MSALTLRAHAVALLAGVGLLVACGSSSDDGGSSSGGSSSGGQTSSSGGGSSTSSGSSSSSSSGSSNGSTPATTKKLGDDCTKGDECTDGKCLTFTDNSGQKRGFCTRQCTKAEDCPEDGWVCNLAPYTACVPK